MSALPNLALREERVSKSVGRLNWMESHVDKIVDELFRLYSVEWQKSNYIYIR